MTLPKLRNNVKGRPPKLKFTEVVGFFNWHVSAWTVEELMKEAKQ